MKKNKFSIEVTEQQLEDLLSALSFTARKYSKSSPNFIKAIGCLDKKLWKIMNKGPK